MNTFRKYIDFIYSEKIICNDKYHHFFNSKSWVLKMRV